MRTFRFLDFLVYKEARDFYKEIILLTNKFSRPYWSLADQMRRSALSICLNIAEGSAKRTDKDFNRYIENALGSISETVAGLDICSAESIVSSATFDRYIIKAESIAKQLGGFSKKLKSSTN